MPGFKLDFPTAIKFGPPGIAAYKAQREAETQGLQAQELRGKIAAQPGVRAETEAKTNRYNEQVRESQTKALGNGLMQALNNPDDNTLKSVFDRLEATGIPTATFREQFAAMPDLAARKQVIRQYSLSNPEGIAALQFTSPKPEKFSLGGREISVDMNPNSETYKQEITSFNKTATPDALLTDARLKEQHVDQLGQWDKLNAAEKARFQEQYRAHNLQDARSRATLAETIANNARVDRREAQKIAQPKFDAGAGGFVYAPTSENPQGKFVPITGIDGKPLNEAQGNAVAFGIRMKEANSIFDKLASEGTERSAVGAGAPYGIGGVVNALPSALGGANPQQQQFQQAKLNFITAVLRKESGAAIGETEFATEDQKYFRQVGDSDAVAAQKKQARQTAIKAMEIQAGPGAKEIQKFEPRGSSSGAATGADPLGLFGKK
jgi:hypothetical protein